MYKNIKECLKVIVCAFLLYNDYDLQSIVSPLSISSKYTESPQHHPHTQAHLSEIPPAISRCFYLKCHTVQQFPVYVVLKKKKEMF